MVVIEGFDDGRESWDGKWLRVDSKGVVTPTDTVVNECDGYTLIK